MEIIYKKVQPNAPNISCNIGVHTSTTKSNAIRMYTNMTSISSGLTNVYTKQEIDNRIGNDRNFVTDFENIYLSN